MSSRPVDSEIFVLPRRLLWLLLFIATMVEAGAIWWVAETYRAAAGFWFYRNLASDPLMVLLTVDLVLMRLVAVLASMRLVTRPDSGLGPLHLMLVPIGGAPLLLAALLNAPQPVTQQP